MKEQNHLLNTYQQLLHQQQPDASDSSAELEQLLDASESYLPNYEPNVDAGFARLKKKIEKETTTPVVQLQPRRQWMKVAATVALIVGTLAAFQLFFSGENIYQIAVATGEGELQTIELADGTLVRLNENSALSYPADFTGDVREVELSGEAFFDVTKNPEQPFVITTGETVVRVLGTSFNVEARMEEKMTKVTVKTGKVEVVDRETTKKVVLEPYEEAIHTHGKKLEKIEDKDLKDLAWHTLDFRKVVFSEVVAAMENHYQIEIETASANVTDCLYTINFADADLSTTLEILKTGLGVNISQTTDNQYTISGGTCKSSSF